MGDKVFNSNIRLKYNYDRGKVGNTVFRPYVYDSNGTSDTMSNSFLSTDMVHPLNTLSDDYKVRYNITNKDDYPGGRRYFLFFKGKNGVNSMFSASNSTMVNNLEKNRDVTIREEVKDLNDYIILKHDLRFDKGTLKYKDKYNNIYTVEGLGNFASDSDHFYRHGTLFGYGQPVSYTNYGINPTSLRGMTAYSNSSDIINSQFTGRFSNNGYSCFMLLVIFSVRFLSSGGASDLYSAYCFIPVCFYDLSILNKGHASNTWKLNSDYLGHAYTRNYYGVSFYITNGINAVGGDESKRMWGYNGSNVSSGKVTTPSAKGIPDVYWLSPNCYGGTSGSIVPPSVYNDFVGSEGFKCRMTVDFTAYHISEMSYKYYMYGDGQSFWRGKEGSMDTYRVKWYPTSKSEALQPNYFLEHNYIY